MTEKRLSVKKDIRQQSEEIINDTEKVLEKLAKLESFAKAKGRPHLHYHSFHRDLQMFVNQFQRMQR